MSCDVLSCDELSSVVKMRCNGMRSYEFVMRCGWLRCHVVWFEVVVWGELEDDLVIRTTQYYKVLLRYYSVLHSTTPYYKVPLQYYSVLQSTTPVDYAALQSTTPVLFCTTKYYSSTTLYYKVLLQYYSVLQSTTPVLLCTTKYYSSTSLYYKVLLQYYSVLHSTTPVLLCTYYSSTNSVLQSTTPVLLCTTQIYNSVLQSTTPVLLCTTKYYSSTILYYKVLLQYYSVLQSTTPVLLRTTKYYSSTSLYYKVLLQYYSVLQSTTPVRVLLQYYKVLLQYYSVLQSTTPVLLLVLQSTHLQCAEQQDSSSNVTKYCTCHAKWLSWVMSVTYETSFTMRGATGVIHQRHQVLCLPRKMTRIIDIWNVIYNARSNSHHPPTSPNAAPATKNDAHHWCPPHMKRHFQCAEQQASPSNLTKYCACHAKLHSKI